MKRLTPRRAAERDIDEAVDYYADEAGEDVARGFIEALLEAYRAIRERPGAGSPRYADILGVSGLRSRTLGRFPFLAFYVEHDDYIEVRRVLHARRDIPASLADSGD